MFCQPTVVVSLGREKISRIIFCGVLAEGAQKNVAEDEEMVIYFLMGISYLWF